MRQTIIATIALLLLCFPVSANAAEWGHVKGRFVYDGTPPKPVALTVDKDRETCKWPLVDESLVVGKEGGIANVVVALYLKPNARKPEIHPDLREPTGVVQFDQEKCRFVPHIVIARAGQTVEFENRDEVGHNLKLDATNNQPFSDVSGAGYILKKAFKGVELRPVPCSCSIHPWMRGYLIIREDPYAAISDEAGNFEIPNLPAGNWTLRVWQERAGFVEDVNVDGKATKWLKGQVDVVIEAGKTFDFGEIKVALREFQEK